MAKTRAIINLDHSSGLVEQNGIDLCFDNLAKFVSTKYHQAVHIVSENGPESGAINRESQGQGHCAEQRGGTLMATQHQVDQCHTHWPTVAICGSMRFFDLMIAEASELTGRGEIVLMPYRVVSAEQQDSPMKRQLDALHRRKIDLSQRVVVVTDHTGYYGESTRTEIEYARELGRSVEFAARAIARA